MKLSFFKAVAAAGLASLVALSPLTHAGGHGGKMDSIHFIIPGGAGGGWDGTARGTGEVLTKSGLVGSASYENMSGGGGGKAIGYLIENAKSNTGTLMVNSTPIVIRSLTKVFPQSFRDLTPIAGTIGDYAALVVKADSDIQTFKDLVKIYENDPNDLAIAGGSVAGGMDHLVAALAMKSAGADPLAVKYLPFDAGGEAMASLHRADDVHAEGYLPARDLSHVHAEGYLPARDLSHVHFDHGAQADHRRDDEQDHGAENHLGEVEHLCRQLVALEQIVGLHVEVVGKRVAHAREVVGERIAHTRERE